MKNAAPMSPFIPDGRDGVAIEGDRSDWAKVRSTTDTDGEAAIASDPDEAGMLIDWDKAKVIVGSRKKTMTIRLDSGVLDFYRTMGRAYQTTINAVLRSYMEHGRR